VEDLPLKDLTNSLAQLGDMNGSLEKLINEERRKIALANEMSNQVAILSLSAAKTCRNREV
jgi:hypothetical protein